MGPSPEISQVGSELKDCFPGPPTPDGLCRGSLPPIHFLFSAVRGSSISHQLLFGSSILFALAGFIHAVAAWGFMLPSFQLCSLFQCEDFLFHLCHCHSWQYFIWKTNAYTPFVLKRFDVKLRIRIVSEELWREEGEEKEEKKERNSIHPTACFDVKYRNPQWVLIQQIQTVNGTSLKSHDIQLLI